MADTVDQTRVQWITHLQDVQSRASTLALERAAGHDPETTHTGIDGLAEHVLELIAAGHADAPAMAQAVLNVMHAPGKEWYA